jgi:hypothetical protein
VLDEMSTRLWFQAPGAPPGSPARAIRAVFVTRRDVGQWHVSSQYTPIRTK